jgi:peptidoglycan/xylan/chitin deacetylase (PgdA/CDA1 family)
MEINVILDCKKEDKPKARYVFGFIFRTLGINFRFSEKEIKDFFNIYFGTNNKKKRRIHLFVPYYSYESWEEKEAKVFWKEEIPLLYIKKKPAYLLKGKRIGFDLVNSIFYLLSRQEEIETERDEWDCFPGYQSLVVKNGLLLKPTINYYLQILENFIKKWAVKNKKDLDLKPLWPENKKFAVALTHDVDQIDFLNYRKVFYSLNSGIRHWGRGFRGALKEFYRVSKKKLSRIPVSSQNFEKIIDLEDKFGFKSIFYFGSQNRYFYNGYDLIYKPSDKIIFRNKKTTLRELMRFLDSSGWEVGLHGSYESSKNSSLLLREKESLEKVLDKEVRGVRQHFLHFDSQKTWFLQSKAGLKYDSSLGFNRFSGWRASVSFPFHPYNPEKKKAEPILEIPLTIMDSSLFVFEKLNPKEAFERTKKTIEQAQNLKGLVVLLWHTHTFNEALYLGWSRAYEQILSYLREKKAFVGSAKDIFDWWTVQRHK